MTDYPRIEPSWIWPAKVERWFRSRSSGRTLHVCCGRSTLGDLRIDRDPSNSPDVLADAWNLPIPDASFDTVISDPPWKMDIFKRHSWFFELVRVCKADGRVLVNATWIPSSHQVQLEELWVRQNSDKAGHSLMANYNRYPGQQELPV